jgi:O-antigen/teichoic acid export membrane protein
MVDGVLTHRWSPLKVIAKYEKQHLLALLKTGLPIYSVANVYGLWPTFQRSMILIDLGPKGLGLYSLSIIVQNTLNTFSNATSSVVFPKMTKAFGAGAKVKEILRIPLKMILIVFIIHCIILIVGWILLPYVVEYLLPKYVEGLEAAKWMLVVSLVSIFFIFSNFFMVVKKNNLRLISFLSGMGVWYIYIKNNIILTSVDLVVYSKGLLLGYITIFIIDSFFYLLILKNKIKV